MMISILKNIFDKVGISLQMLACVLTYIIVSNEIDWKYFVSVQSILNGEGAVASVLRFFSLATGLGMLVPIIIMPTIYIAAKIFKDKSSAATSLLIMIAAFAGWLVSAIYKSFTGRVQPPHSLLVNTSHDWNFGFYQHGIFWGWPSSHTTVAFAMAFAYIYYFKSKNNKRQKIYNIVAVLFAVYIGVGITMQIHWFSEFVAGSLIGFVVGRAVGRSLGNNYKVKL